MTDRIKVLVVDDSAVARKHLVFILETDPRIHVIGTASDGRSALAFLERQVPDAIVMDIVMPGMNGFETTRQIMETQPVPIIICTSTASTQDVATTFNAMDAGAVAFVQKPPGREHADFVQLAEDLRRSIRLMSEIKVVRRWPRSRAGTRLTAREPAVPEEVAPEHLRRNSSIKIIGIGTSTGGPPVLQTILKDLPRDFPTPILIVQHIAHGFLPGLAEWLNQTTALQVHVGSHGATPLPGHVYMAPDGFHMGIAPTECILLSPDPPENGLRPAVGYLFRSLATICGPAAAGVLLTGMGKDGAAELKMMRNTGAITIAQDRDSSIVHGMPGEAIAMDAAVHVVSDENIAGLLLQLVGYKHGKGAK